MNRSIYIPRLEFWDHLNGLNQANLRVAAITQDETLRLYCAGYQAALEDVYKSIGAIPPEASPETARGSGIVINGDTTRLDRNTINGDAPANRRPQSPEMAIGAGSYRQE